METLEEVLLRCSGVREASLYEKAKKTLEKPETGITIHVPAARHVLQDSARITVLYLPHFIWAQLANPVGVFKGKVNLEQIKDFVTRSQQNSTTLQLLKLILDKGKDIQNISPDFENNLAKQQYHTCVFILSKLFGVV